MRWLLQLPPIPNHLNGRNLLELKQDKNRSVLPNSTNPKATKHDYCRRPKRHNVPTTSIHLSRAPRDGRLFMTRLPTIACVLVETIETFWLPSLYVRNSPLVTSPDNKEHSDILPGRAECHLWHRVLPRCLAPIWKVSFFYSALRIARTASPKWPMRLT